MGKDPRRDLFLERRWRELIKDQKRSGSSIQAFCDRRGVSASSFHYWKRELAKREGQRPTGGRREGPRSLEDFVPVRVSAGSPDARGAMDGIEIVVAGAIIRVRRGFEEETLARVVAVLGDRSPREGARPC